MTKRFDGRIRFLRVDEGGRPSPPTGPRYVTTAVEALPAGSQPPPGWPWSGGQFSLVVELGEPGRYEWTPVRASALAPDAPEAAVLRRGARLVVLEGPRPVAELRIDD